LPAHATAHECSENANEKVHRPATEVADEVERNLGCISRTDCVKNAGDGQVIDVVACPGGKNAVFTPTRQPSDHKARVA